MQVHKSMLRKLIIYKYLHTLFLHNFKKNIVFNLATHIITNLLGALILDQVVL